MRRRPSVATGKARRPNSHGDGGGVIAGDYPHEEYDTDRVCRSEDKPDATHIQQSDARRPKRTGWEKKNCEPTIALSSPCWYNPCKKK
jgi:hypothetical protein